MAGAQRVSCSADPRHFKAVAADWSPPVPDGRQPLQLYDALTPAAHSGVDSQKGHSIGAPVVHTVCSDHGHPELLGLQPPPRLDTPSADQFHPNSCLWSENSVVSAIGRCRVPLFGSRWPCQWCWHTPPAGRQPPSSAASPGWGTPPPPAQSLVAAHDARVGRRGIRGARLDTASRHVGGPGSSGAVSTSTTADAVPQPTALLERTLRA